MEVVIKYGGKQNIMSKVLLIMSALFAGGAEKQYRYIMEALSDCFDVEVLMVNKPLKGMEEITNKFITEHSNIKFIQLKGNSLNNEKKGKIVKNISKVKTLIIQYLWLHKNLHKGQINVVMFSYVTQLLMTDYFIKNNIKIVFNERNTGRQICDKKFKISLLKKCNKVVCNSISASKYINEKTGIKVDVINNGIEVKSISKKKHTGFNIIVPARVNAIKNQMVVIKALEKLREYVNEETYEKIECAFVGTIEDDKYALMMKNAISRLGVNVKFLGFKNNIDEFYEVCDLIILPSYEEGTPNVLLEAYMYGLRCLVSNIETNKDCSLSDDILFNPDNPEELAFKIYLIVKEKGIPNSMEAELNYVLGSYGIPMMKDNYKRVINSLLS